MSGILRHAIGDKEADSFFGFQGNGKDGKGSEIIFSSAQIVNQSGNVIDGLQQIDDKSEFYNYFKNLPIRQHVSIGSSGSAKKRGKFDEQIVFKGTRFCFEIEMLSDGRTEDCFQKVLKQIYSKTFRVGSGTRCGFGEMKIVSCKTLKLDLRVAEDMKAYLDKSSSLASSGFWDKKGEEICVLEQPLSFVEYKVTLKPDDFFLFGSGFGNDNSDMPPVTEMYIGWDQKGHCQFNTNMILIPATSVKGAVAHRVAYYFNKLNGWFIDSTENKDLVGSANEAVRTLFGSEDDKCPQRGRVILSDIFEDTQTKSKKKVLKHVSIDAFTGGAAKGALFTEEVVCAGKKQYVLKLQVEKCAIEDKSIRIALHRALRDLTTGMLPLGGGTNRGNGCFTGTLERTDKGVIDYE